MQVTGRSSRNGHDGPEIVDGDLDTIRFPILPVRGGQRKMRHRHPGGILRGPLRAPERIRHFFLIALKGALAGGAAAALTFAVASLWARQSLATPESDQATALFGGFSMGAAGYIGVLAIVIVVAVLTALTTRITVLRTILEIDTIRSDPSHSI